VVVGGAAGTLVRHGVGGIQADLDGAEPGGDELVDDRDAGIGELPQAVGIEPRANGAGGEPLGDGEDLGQAERRLAEAAEDHLAHRLGRELALDRSPDLWSRGLLLEAERVPVDLVGEAPQAEDAGTGTAVGEIHIDVAFATIGDNSGAAHRASAMMGCDGPSIIAR